MPFDNSRPTDGIDDVQWLAFDALGNFSGGTGVQATHRQIFLKNLISNEIRQITFGTDGDSTRPNLGSLGGLITFESTARLTNNPTPPGIPQIYVYETNSRTLRQITNGSGRARRRSRTTAGADRLPVDGGPPRLRRRHRCVAESAGRSTTSRRTRRRSIA
jgi:Tol biopolymer transport system component